jgi:hypothetical protein
MIRKVMLAGQSLNPVHDQMGFILRESREEMMFNLIVKITHPPVDERRWFDVSSVAQSILDPVGCFLRDGQVGVAESKVSEHVIRSEPVHEEEEEKVRDAEVGDDPVETHHSKVQVVALF